MAKQDPYNKDKLAPGSQSESLTEIEMASKVQPDPATRDDLVIQRTNGYKPQLKREFTALQLIGTAFTITNSWLGVAGAFSTGISAAGPANIIYGLMLMFALNIFVATALSELMSAMPNSGGQYYWTMKLAPYKVARPFAYMTGVCNIFAAYCVSASSTIATSFFFLGCAKLSNSELELTSWRVYLVSIAITLLVAIPNIWKKVVPKTILVGFIISVATCISVTIPLPAAAPEHTDAKFIFGTIERNNGWSTNGMAFIMGLINSNWSFGLLDGAAHFSEETPDPARNVPKAVMLTVFLGFTTAFPFVYMLMYTLVNFETVINTETGNPIVELLYIALGRTKPAALAATVFIGVAYFFSLLPQQAYQSRVVWAFSRDKGLPFSSIWSQVSDKTHVPLQAHALSVLMVIIIELLYIASTIAFNSLVTGVIVFPYLTYLAPMTFSLWRGNDQPRGPFSAGLFGKVSKVITIVFCLFAIIMYSFPFVMPVEASNMNYATALYGVALFYGLVDCIVQARYKFQHLERSEGTIVHS